MALGDEAEKLAYPGRMVALFPKNQSGPKRPQKDKDLTFWSKGTVQYKGDARNHGLSDPSVYVVFWAPIHKLEYHHMQTNRGILGGLGV